MRRLLSAAVLAITTSGCVGYGMPGGVVAIEYHAAQAAERRRNYTLPPPEPPAEGPPVETMLPPAEADAAKPLAPSASPETAKDIQAKVDALALSSCANDEVTGRASLLVGGDGRVKHVTLENGARLASEIGACVRLRLRAIDGLATNGERVLVTVEWSTATARL